jgi:hypothetical protein
MQQTTQRAAGTQHVHSLQCRNGWLQQPKVQKALDVEG